MIHAQFLLALTVLTSTPALRDHAGPDAELRPVRTVSRSGVVIGRYSSRTIVLALEADRDQARLLRYTVKDRPFFKPVEAPATGLVAGSGQAELEVALVGPQGVRLTQHLAVPSLCLEHDAFAEPHVEGDTIRVHRDSFLVEVPEVAGFDRVEVAYPPADGFASTPVSLAVERLDASRFVATDDHSRYADLAFASEESDQAPGDPASLGTSGAVHWPEEFADPDRYRVYGKESEVSRRINIVLVPDGYTYAEKATMQAHADQLVQAFRARTPYAEHDVFINYILVYAYSSQTGTDQCDCGTVKDTAMGTRFPNAGYACKNSGNRCLYYGTQNGGPDCDSNTSDVNIAAAELRAPARDHTIVMVNTTRYGGCGGSRAVVAAGNSSAAEIAIHEIGHSFAGLADEYGGSASCGSADRINASSNPGQGNWPEWIGDPLAAPVEGAGYYERCVFRPEANCEMRSLGVPFCRVCTQRFALSFFGHARVAPSAPIASATPAPAVALAAGVEQSFSVATRLAVGSAVTNSVTWQLKGPGDPAPVVVATDVPSFTTAFTVAGTYTLTCEVVADTNFIKPVKNGANRDVATWTITVGDGGSGSGGGGTPSCGQAGASCTRNDACCSQRCDTKKRKCRL